MDARAVTPVVGKLLEAGLAVVFVGVVLAGLNAGVVPGFQATATDETAERALAAGADGVESAARAGAEGEVRIDAGLPSEIGREPYTLRGAGDELTIAYGDTERRVPLSLPKNVTVTGTWVSGGPMRLELTDGTLRLGG